MKQSTNARRFFYILLSAIILFSAWLLKPYLTVLTFAVLLAFLFHPLYTWIERSTKGRNWIAVPLALLCVLLTFIVPLILAGLLVANVVAEFAHNAASSNLSSGFSVNAFVDQMNALLVHLPGGYQLAAATVHEKLLALAAAVQSSAWHGLQGIGGKLSFVIPTIFITIYVMGAVFTRYHRISQYLHRLSPLHDEIDTLYARRITSMIVSMVKGTLVIALIQGVLTGLLFWVTGVPYAAFFGLLATIASIIPLGSGIIAIPVGLILILTGSVWQGIFQIATNVLIVSNVDNILRPRLVSKEASLHPALTLLGVFAGIAQFGFLGVIYGPVCMVVLVTTLEVYREYFAPQE
ncbi:MAG TPA: AI-2E family transporter [Verrucomicrobiae bacterium]|nr:AI-2E family transporter [Verrucomicrobiae bacterium]